MAGVGRTFEGEPIDEGFWERVAQSPQAAKLRNILKFYQQYQDVSQAVADPITGAMHEAVPESSIPEPIAALMDEIEKHGGLQGALETMPMTGVVYGGAETTRRVLSEAIKQLRKSGTLQGSIKRGLLATLKKGIVATEKPAKTIAKAAKEKGVKKVGGYYATTPTEPVVPRTPLRGSKEEARLLKAMEEGNIPAEMYLARPESAPHEIGHAAYRGMQPAEKAAIARVGARAPHPRATYEPIGEETFAHSIGAPEEAPQAMLDYMDILKQFML
jgi:hypothetical protein